MVGFYKPGLLGPTLSGLHDIGATAGILRIMTASATVTLCTERRPRRARRLHKLRQSDPIGKTADGDDENQAVTHRRLPPTSKRCYS
jgi:hypothetical protein